MANHQESVPGRAQEDPANPNIGSQDAFNRFVDRHTEHLLSDDAGLYGDIYPMSSLEREMKMRAVEMPSFEADTTYAADEGVLETPLTAQEEDMILESLKMPAIRDAARNTRVLHEAGHPLGGGNSNSPDN